MNLARRLPLLAAWRHTVVHVHDGPVRALVEAAGVPCRRVSGIVRPADPTLVPRALGLLDALAPDVVICHLWLACILGRLHRRRRGVPQIGVLHQDADFDGAWRRAGTGLVGFPDSAVVAVSEPVRAAAVRRFPMLAGRVRVIPNGIAAGAVRAEAEAGMLTRAELGIGADEFVVAAVGRFDPVKNFGRLLRAVAACRDRIPRLRLLLVGAGSLERELRAEAERLRLGDRIVFVVDRPAIPLLALADLFVQPSETEGVSNALLEALALGVPALVSVPPGGHPVIRDGENGFLIPRGPVALEESLVALSEDGERRIRIGEAGRADVQARWSLEASVSAYDALFREVLGR